MISALARSPPPFVIHCQHLPNRPPPFIIDCQHLPYTPSSLCQPLSAFSNPPPFCRWYNLWTTPYCTALQLTSLTLGHHCFIQYRMDISKSWLGWEGSKTNTILITLQIFFRLAAPLLWLLTSSGVLASPVFHSDHNPCVFKNTQGVCHKGVVKMLT